ncbi:MAG: YbaB/EbfC family nucleoid-associated protein [Alphaproteobacteria bacterium]|nr:YbaB/EbfC family nucleoid-associated protein [Alphaproteobacteria bacterium]
MQLSDLFKQAKDIQAKTQQMQAMMAAIEVEGISGGGMVKVTLTGKNDLKKLLVDPSLLKPEDRQIVEDLIVAAHADAKAKLERRVSEEMQRMARDMGIPNIPGLGI